ncbi:FkbM family methyltransferase [Hyunsoonleella ulvae]|uniref:FkbM family methyltransferase n=1 Tax=Hyunsoonleella ulvae TaxID=2799948 RepID=UPI00193AAC5D|nr:FkbM family methyltransferase [Hyunsoonleella ulvae]
MIQKIKKHLRNILFRKRIENQKKQDKIQLERCKPWFKVDGDNTLRIKYPLNDKSVVFDLGGYKGEFAEIIYTKYQPTIYIFEPIKAFYDVILEKFTNNDKVNVYQFGLSGKNENVKISLTNNASSVYIKSKKYESIQLKSITEFIKINKIEKVDLIKINIEGGEYEVLESLIENNMLRIFKNIQVQFHDFIIPNARERMQGIQTELSKTHKLTYQYEFVWENWELK